MGTYFLPKYAVGRPVCQGAFVGILSAVILLKLSAASCGESSILKRNKPSVSARLPRSKLREMARWRLQSTLGSVLS